MRVGVMLRSIDEDQGIGIYTRNLIPRLLRADPDTEYVLIYRTPRYRGHFAAYPNAVEVFLDLPTKPLWDQVGSPWLARRYGVDVIFNTKFTLPLFTGRRSVMMLHGSMQFVHPECFHPLDIAYLNRFMPAYCWKADHLISNSELTTNDFVERLGVPREKMTTIHLAADDRFRQVKSSKRLAMVRAKYHLPERFVLSVTKYFPGKNIPTLIHAYARLPRELRSALVLVGRGVDRYLDDLHLRGTPIEREIVTPGWIDQRDLPAVYSMADVFAFPSYYEEFGIPVVEAMACGCPVVASNTGALPEITDGAALLVDPLEVEALGDALARVLEDELLRVRLRTIGLRRARHFSWEEHARQTVQVLRRAC
jgi:glycosyltransferase involved in cell wall biosynthesis